MATPKLRFKEFDGGWTKSTIQFFMDNNFILDQMDGNHGELYPKSEEFSATGVPYISATDFSFGDVNFATCKRLPIERAKLFKKGIAKNGDVLFAHNATVGPVAILKTDLDFVILSTTATYYRCEATYLNNHYLKNYFESDFFVQQYFGIMSQSTRNQVPITTQRKLNIAVPNIQEQTKIASFLSAVDEKISQLTQKHELLSQYKQGMMQKLFSQQIRFKADDGSEFGEWESRSLGEVGENIIGLTYSPTDVTNDGSGILVLRSSNIKNGRLDKSDQVRVNKKIKDKIIVQANDILICTRNGSQRLIGKSVIINDDEEMTFGAFMSVYRSEYNRFIAYLMQTPWFFEQVQMNLGARINQITTGTLNEFTFDFPCLEEQTKIANFLSAIDQKIEVVAQQIEQAKTWKKGLLQQMFV